MEAYTIKRIWRCEQCKTIIATREAAGWRVMEGLIVHLRDDCAIIECSCGHGNRWGYREGSQKDA